MSWLSLTHFYVHKGTHTVLPSIWGCCYWAVIPRGRDGRDCGGSGVGQSKQKHEFLTTTLCVLTKTINQLCSNHICGSLGRKEKYFFILWDLFYLWHRRMTYFLLFLVFLLFLAVRVIVSLFLLLFRIRVGWSFYKVKTETHLGQFKKCYTPTSWEMFFSVPWGSGSCGRWCLCLCLLFFFGGCMCISLYCSGSWKTKINSLAYKMMG